MIQAFWKNGGPKPSQPKPVSGAATPAAKGIFNSNSNSASFELCISARLDQQVNFVMLKIQVNLHKTQMLDLRIDDLYPKEDQMATQN